MAVYQRFLERMYNHCAEYWPRETEKLGKQGVIQLIEKCVERLKKYNVVEETNIAQYLDLVFVWDEDFDQSNRTPWAAEILNDDTLDSSIKIHQLCYRTELELAGR